MKYLKTFFKALKSLGLPISPGIIAMILLAIALLLLFWRYRKKKKEEAEGAEGPAAAPGAATSTASQQVPKDRFTRIWQRFKDDLPAVVRRSLGGFAPFVVMGTERASTARLINTYTDWERQARSLFGSHVDDPDLRIYLGSRVLVLDMPESVLNETSSSARKALLRLWRPLFRRRTPVVVAVVSPSKLASLRPEQIGDLADAIRGKVNLLSWVRKKPIEIRVALTDLDRVPGFTEVAELAAKRGIPLEIPLTEGMADYQLEGQLNERFAELQRFVELGLTDLAAPKFSESFTELVAFLRDAPTKLSPGIADFLAALMVRQPLGEQPILRTVYLTSPDGSTEPNPFDTKTRPDEVRSPLFWHALAAGAASLVLLSAVVGGYLYERSLWKLVDEALRIYEAEGQTKALRQQATREAQLRGAISLFANRTAFPGFFANAQTTMQRKLRHRIREIHIRPKFDNALESRRRSRGGGRFASTRDADHGVRQAIYLLALAYAATDNSLGQLVHDREMIRHWAERTELDEAVILDYILSAKTPGIAELSTALQVDELVNERVVWTDESFDKEWLPFFRRVEEHVTERRLTPVDLTALQDQAKPMTSQLARLFKFPQVPRMLQLLTNLDPKLAGLEHALEDDLLELQDKSLQSEEKRKEIGRFMSRIIKTRRLEAENPERLEALCDWVRDQLETQSDEEGERAGGILSLFVVRNDGTEDLVEFRVGDHAIREADWLLLTRDNTIRQTIARFRSRARGRPEGLFFSAADQFSPLELNQDRRGAFLFTGKARIPGKYTVPAVADRIVPPLECLAEVWSDLRKIAPTESGELSQAIEAELKSYARHYGRHTDTYYRKFGLDAKDSITRLRSILDAMTRSTSPFNQHLLDVAANTRLPGHSPFAGQYLQPLVEVLEPYRILREVATSTQTADTPLGSYLELVGQLQDNLQIQPAGSEAPADATEAEDGPSLSARLSPVGRMALEMLHCGPDSVHARVEGWLNEVQMPRNLRKPFLELPWQIYLVGREDLQNVASEVWRQEVVTELRAISQKFPFSPGRDADAKPEELAQLFHPITGRITLTRQTYLDPIYKPTEGSECRFAPASQRPLRPRNSSRLSKKITALTQRLWNEKGEPQLLRVAVEPIAFRSRLSFEAEAGDDPNVEPPTLEELLTLTFVSSGASTLVNFNQRPFAADLDISWTGPHIAQVGVRLTHPETRKETMPERLTEESHWALLRLLRRARQSVRDYTWQVPFTRKAGSRRRLVLAEAAFRLQEDPFALFEFTEFLEMHARAPVVKGNGQ